MTELTTEERALWRDNPNVADAWDLFDPPIQWGSINMSAQCTERMFALRLEVLRLRQIILATPPTPSRPTPDEWCKFLDGSKLVSNPIGPLYQAGWNKCIEVLKERYAALFPASTASSGGTDG